MWSSPVGLQDEIVIKEGRIILADYGGGLYQVPEAVRHMPMVQEFAISTS
jgi:hypothetical protein